MRSLVLAAMLGCALGAAPATWADVTPDQVYDSWTAAATGMGGSLTAVIERAPGKMVLNGLTYTPGSGAEIELGPVTLRQTPERTVEITLPERFQLVLRPEDGPGFGPAKRLVFQVAMPGFRGYVNGLDDAATSYGMTAGSVSVTLDRVEPALPLGQSLMLTLAAADLELSWDEGWKDAGRAGKAGKGVARLGTIHADLAYALEPAPGGPGEGSASFDLAGLDAGMQIYITRRMLGADAPDPERDLAAFLEELRRGLLVTLHAETGQIASQGDLTDSAGEPVSYALAAATAGGSFTIDRSGVAYDNWLGPGRIDLSAPGPEGTPGSYGIGWEDYRNAVGIGMLDLTVSEPWSFLFQLTGVTLSDSIWAEADPMATLPRDPAAVVMDLGGTFAVDPIVLRPGGMPAEGEEVPLTRMSIELRKLMAAGLGLDFRGTGGVELDFTQSIGPEGAPGAEGRVDFVTKGSTALIGRLEQAGLLTADEISGLRFALLFMGRAGAEPDTLETSIEFRGGHLWLNGQQID